jgi:hypothetical protein
MDPDSEQLNEEVVEYQDTGDFMNPDSEKLENGNPKYQDTGEFLDPGNAGIGLTKRIKIFHIRFHLKAYRTIFFIFRFIRRIVYNNKNYNNNKQYTQA